MIKGAHVIISSSDAEADRDFVKDVLGFAGIDAGGGWRSSHYRRQSSQRTQGTRQGTNST